MIATVFNVMPHYRREIYLLMDKELKCDFYAGDKIPLPLNMLEPSELKGFKYMFKNTYFYKAIYWQRGIHKIFKPKYTTYIITGDPYCISNWFVLLYAKLTSKKAFIWAHGLNGHEGVAKLFFKKMFFKLGYKTFLYSDFAKNFMVSIGFKESKLIPIYNSLSYEEQLKSRENVIRDSSNEKLFDNPYPYLIYVGRIQEEEKKLYLIIEAINVLREEGIKVNLLLVGRIIEDKKIRALMLKYNLEDQVKFYGPLFDENTLGKLFYNANSCVCPGNIGLTAVHSLNYGTPVITHDRFELQMPEYESVTNNVTGSFFKYNQIDDLKTYIKKWVNLEEKQREQVRLDCFDMIDTKYNPLYQIEILKNHILESESEINSKK